MDKETANKLAKEYDEKISSMTSEEKKEHFKSYGFIENELEESNDVEEGKHFTKIYNKKKVMEKLRNNLILLDKYHYAIINNPDCIKAALEGNTKNYEYIPEFFKRKRWVANAYYTAYIKEHEEGIDEEEKYSSYYPVYLDIIEALKHNEDEAPIDVIKKIVNEISDEELENLLNEYESLSLAFINPNMNPSIAALEDQNILSDRQKTRK